MMKAKGAICPDGVLRRRSAFMCAAIQKAILENRERATAEVYRADDAWFSAQAR